MYISKIDLLNIRGFSSLKFNLEREGGRLAGWTVFTGDNGSGKSSLLKAIALCLVGRDTARSLQASFNRWVKDDSLGQSGSIQLTLAWDNKDDSLGAGGTPPGRKFPAKIELDASKKETILVETRPAGKAQNYQTPQRTIWSPSAKGWFSCGYGPFRRVFGSSPVAARQMVAPATERFVTMFQEAASLEEVDQWLKGLKYKALEQKENEMAQLDVVMEILKDDLLPNQISVDRVDSDGLWLKDRNGVSLSWFEMSDGYRAALALLTDVIRHLITAYGVEGLTQRGEDGKLRIIRSGVVLIDEVDAHLHPEWQRQIGFWLKDHFPNIQFIVTTHSPLVCQAADEQSIFVLPEPGGEEFPRQLTQEEWAHIIASRPDAILRGPAFGLENTRSDLAVEMASKFSRLNEKKRSGKQLETSEQKQWIQLRLFAEDEEEE
jgi:energy-coupling factor transporter ATP-binding protein EcfA2